MLWPFVGMGDYVPRINGERLRAIREQRLLTQADLAAKIRSTKAQLSRLENGKQAAQISTVRRLAEALAIEPTELLATDAG